MSRKRPHGRSPAVYAEIRGFYTYTYASNVVEESVSDLHAGLIPASQITVLSFFSLFLSGNAGHRMVSPRYIIVLTSECKVDYRKKKNHKGSQCHFLASVFPSKRDLPGCPQRGAIPATFSPSLLFFLSLFLSTRHKPRMRPWPGAEAGTPTNGRLL